MLPDMATKARVLVSLLLPRGKYLFRHVAPSEGITHQFFRQLYPSIIRDITVSVVCVCVCVCV